MMTVMVCHHEKTREKTSYDVWSTLVLAAMNSQMVPVVPVSAVEEYVLGYMSKTASACETYSYQLQQGYQKDQHPPPLLVEPTCQPSHASLLVSCAHDLLAYVHEGVEVQLWEGHAAEKARASQTFVIYVREQRSAKMRPSVMLHLEHCSVKYCV
jgi:hypothetical protein